MQDEPAPKELLSAVAAFLRTVVAVEAEPRTAFQARVAANALDLVGRQITLQSAESERELERLTALLGEGVSIEELNDGLARALSNGTLTMQSPGVAEHLWLTTLAKLAVDQPNYASYRAELAARDACAPKGT